MTTDVRVAGDLDERVPLPEGLAGSPGRTAFVLGGGGNLGAVQVGMLFALIEAGIRPDLVVGTSIGALNGAYLAGHRDLVGMQRLGHLVVRRSGDRTSSASTSGASSEGFWVGGITCSKTSACGS